MGTGTHPRALFPKTLYVMAAAWNPLSPQRRVDPAALLCDGCSVAAAQWVTAMHIHGREFHRYSIERKMQVAE